jgi:hypothetical protein
MAAKREDLNLEPVTHAERLARGRGLPAHAEPTHGRVVALWTVCTCVRRAGVGTDGASAGSAPKPRVTGSTPGTRPGRAARGVSARCDAASAAGRHTSGCCAARLRTTRSRVARIPAAGRSGGASQRLSAARRRVARRTRDGRDDDSCEKADACELAATHSRG